MKYKVLGLVAAFAIPMAAQALPIRTKSGSSHGLSWQAESRIVGVTGTGTVVSGGDPLYLGAAPKYRGTVGLLMDYGVNSAGVPQRFVCSGSMSSDRSSIITAAHCVSDGTRARPNSVTAYFYDGNPEDPSVYVAGAAGVTTVGIRNVYVNPLYTGEVIDQNDIAVLRLDGLAPSFATGYDLYLDDDLTGDRFNVAGYGRRSDTGGVNGVTAPNGLGTGRLRQGDNRFDFRLGDADFGGFFDGGPNGFFGTADTRFSFVSDFDNGLAANDASCLLAVSGLGVAASGKYCDLGLGAIEVGVAGGDSGGPQFIDGKLAAVTSYGLSFGPDFGDFGGGLNSGFGEFSGFVPTSIHAEWIAGVPEPSSWALMITGFGLVGGMARRTRKTVTA